MLPKGLSGCLPKGRPESVHGPLDGRHRARSRTQGLVRFRGGHGERTNNRGAVPCICSLHKSNALKPTETPLRPRSAHSGPPASNLFCMTFLYTTTVPSRRPDMPLGELRCCFTRHLVLRGREGICGSAPWLLGQRASAENMKTKDGRDCNSS